MIQPILTSDGSHTLFNQELNETYHSRHGAIQESRHVFITNGFLHCMTGKKKMNILEVGFGTGLNAMLTLTSANNLSVNYIAVDLFPLEKNTLRQINYASVLNWNGHEKDCFIKMHDAAGKPGIALSDNFSFQFIKDDFTHLSFSEKFDLIYYDAFGPRAQPGMWKREVLERAYHCLTQGGILVSYCAKGDVKRIFKSFGAAVEALAGPPGKREMIRITKND